MSTFMDWFKIIGTVAIAGLAGLVVLVMLAGAILAFFSLIGVAAGAVAGSAAKAFCIIAGVC